MESHVRAIDSGAFLLQVCVERKLFGERHISNISPLACANIVQHALVQHLKGVM